MGGLAFELHAFASNDHLFNFYKMCPPSPQSIGEHFNTYRLSTCRNTAQGLITFDLIYKNLLNKSPAQLLVLSRLWDAWTISVVICNPNIGSKILILSIKFQIVLLSLILSFPCVITIVYLLCYPHIYPLPTGSKAGDDITKLFNGKLGQGGQLSKEVENFLWFAHFLEIPSPLNYFYVPTHQEKGIFIIFNLQKRRKY